jgi:hypothetical protein
MTEFSGLWTTSGTPAGDQQVSYTQAQLSVAFETLSGGSLYEGVIPSFLGELAGSDGGANTCNIANGRAMVDGKYYDNSATIPVNIPSAVGGGNTRIDRIVARAVWASFTVRIFRIAGVDAASPTPPAITQTSGSTYDIQICQALVDTAGNVTVTDERRWNIVDTDDVSIINTAGTLEVGPQGIATAELKDGNVTLAKMASNSVDSDQYVNRSIDAVHIATGAITANEMGVDSVNSSEIAANAVTNSEIASGTILVGNMAADSVDSAQYVDRSIDAVHIATGTITSNELGANCVDSSELVNGSVDLAHMSANSVDSNQYVDGSIDQVHLANNIVDDAKIEHRVPKLTKRKGGNATNWWQSGTTTYTPTDVLMQAGVHSMGAISSGAGASTTISYPTAFSGEPIVLMTVDHVASLTDVYAGPGSASDATQLQIQVWNSGGSAVIMIVNWLAIGPG